MDGRAWFAINTVVMVGSLAAPWVEAAPDGGIAAFGYTVVVFANFVIPSLPGLLAGRVIEPVTLSDAWLGLSVLGGWFGVITYVGLVGGAGVRRRRPRVGISILSLATATAGFCEFVYLSGTRVDDLAWGFWLLCTGLVSSVGLEATLFLATRKLTVSEGR